MSFEPPSQGSGYLVLMIPEPCPLCGIQGPFIPLQVIGHHLGPEGLSLARDWTKAFLCSNPDCDAFYYCLWQVVPIQYANKPLGFKKNSPPPHPLCYCLGFTKEEILREGSDKGPGSRLWMIQRHMAKTPQMCSRKNPTGVCCWDQVQRVLEKGV